ncbi:MAG TPA: helix-turn-helix domain-containing protein, partial [Bryobacteraceae bacterium]|nr:helix-turn-helix domain-containing protein [Bryobacteraceae bacterium]
ARRGRVLMPALLQDRRYTVAELSELVGVSGEMLAQWRARGGGPAFLQLSPRKVVYSESDVEAWLASRRQKGGREIQHGTQAKGRVLALPFCGPRPGALGKHRFGGHRKKQEVGGANCGGAA